MPLFLVPVLAWLVQYLKDNTFGIAMATAFLALMVAYLAALSALYLGLSVTAPPVVIEALDVFMPSQWALHLTTIASIETLAIAHRTFMKMTSLFGQSR